MERTVRESLPIIVFPKMWISNGLVRITELQPQQRGRPWRGKSFLIAVSVPSNLTLFLPYFTFL